MVKYGFWGLRSVLILHSCVTMLTIADFPYRKFCYKLCKTGTISISNETSYQSQFRATDEMALSKRLEKFDTYIDSNSISISQAKNSLERHSNDFLGKYEATPTEPVLSKTSSEIESDGSFLVPMKDDGKSVFTSPMQDYLSKSTTPLRLFNRRGKPLTDRTGRSLANIYGEPLVVFDDEGRVISDSKGNQIFNCFGKSAIHSNTDLRVFPIEEPGIPVMDFHKKHVLFLFDSKGHPMIDSIGRPLLKASGKRMFGIDAKEMVNPDDYKGNRLKSMYGKTPLENVVRKVQIFNADLVPLTDENGKPIHEEQIICNKDGMPMCDDVGRPLYFNYGARVFTPQTDAMPMSMSFSKGPTVSTDDIPSDLEFNSSQNHVENQLISEANVIDQTFSGTKGPLYNEEINLNAGAITNTHNADIKKTSSNTDVDYNRCGSDCTTMNTNDKDESHEGKDNNRLRKNYTSETATMDRDYLTKGIKPQDMANGMICTSPESECSNDAIIIFDATKKLENKRSSSTNICLKEGTENVNRLKKRYFTKRLDTSNVVECIRNCFNLPTLLKASNQTPQYNNYGKPTQDLYGNPLYDKFGIPLTGAHGIKINGRARHTLRVKLRNTSIPRSQNDTSAIGFIGGTHDNFGEPYYDKYGRPLYDLFGRFMYDVYGRPLTDAFGRPLVDAIGQPLMDSKGNVLTSASSAHSDVTLTDIFGRPLHDKYGRSLFDTYGRPRFDIYTNAIYDNCGRPARDGNDAVLFDFLNRPIQPYPEKPLYKNARTLLPRYIDKILEVPSMYRVFKFSHTTLNDLFGGPLFDDFGRPLYNKKGKPLYDKYGRTLYDKDGRPLCDCYGRPLSQDIRESPNDQTLSVVDSLKLLTITKESSQWMEMRRGEMKGLRPSNQEIDYTDGMKVFKPSKHKSTQYIYALTRVTSFSGGKQALEILEAPLSSATAAEMHRLPIDNKPLIMKTKRRRRDQVVKRRQT